MSIYFSSYLHVTRIISSNIFLTESSTYRFWKLKNIIDDWISCTSQNGLKYKLIMGIHVKNSKFMNVKQTVLSKFVKI